MTAAAGGLETAHAMQRKHVPADGMDVLHVLRGASPTSAARFGYDLTGTSRAAHGPDFVWTLQL
jgi:hypothetical protein